MFCFFGLRFVAEYRNCLESELVGHEEKFCNEGVTFLRWRCRLSVVTVDI
jgi:hypothetical protein